MAMTNFRAQDMPGKGSKPVQKSDSKTEEKKAEPTRGAKPVPAMALMPSFLAR